MGSPAYETSVRASLVERLKRGETPTTLHRETGIPIGTLCRWKSTPATIPSMPKSSLVPEPKKPRSTRQWGMGDKLRVLAAVGEATEEALGGVLRREGIHEADLALWRQELREVLTAQANATRVLAAKLEASERELREVKALLELKKKADALFGTRAEGEVTLPPNEKPSER